MQKLSNEALTSVEDISKESVPALSDAMYYFALVPCSGGKILCLLNEDKYWVPVTYQQMMEML